MDLNRYAFRSVWLLHAADDVEGFSRWTLTAAGPSCAAVFEEEGTATKPLLRRLALVPRPAFQANHGVMMRHGRAGLQTYLSGYAAALGRSRA